MFDKLNYQPDQWQYVHREVQILQKLTDAQRSEQLQPPCITEMYDVVETSQFLYLFMELAGALKRYLEQI